MTMKKKIEIEVRLSATQRAFVESSAQIVWLIGPQGEGKTFAGFIGLLTHQRRMGKAVRAALIRDTFQNIKTMTIPSIQDILGLMPVEFARSFGWHDGGRKLQGPGLDVDLFGIDDLGSLTKLQGGEYSAIWLEEPAPMVERANAGLPEQVFTAALSRVARQRGAVPRLQVTMNPADEEHWTYCYAVQKPINTEHVKTQVFNIPHGENTHLTDIQRQTASAAFANDPALYSRYVEGKFAFAAIGEKVTPEYSEDLHRSREVIAPIPFRLTYRFWDGGLNPTCVICQVAPSGRINILDAIVGSNIGVRQLIETQVRPVIAGKYREITEWRDIGDPSMQNREQSSSDTSAAKVIEDTLHTCFLPGPVSWEARREALKEALSRVIDGRGMLQVSRSAEVIHKALRGGWHYRKTNTGQVLRDIPEKDIHSHPGDALSYGLAHILPWKPRPRIIEEVYEPLLAGVY